MNILLTLLLVGTALIAFQPLLLLLMPDRMFVPLSRRELELLHKNEDFQDLYVDCLALLQDLLCRFVGDHGRPRFSNVDQALEALGEVVASGIHQAQIEPEFAPVAENMTKNLNRARILAGGVAGNSGDPPEQVAQEISLFLDTTLQQFQLVTLPRS
ncbi:MAG: hypothetical protein ABI353_04675 [Isosphaeraceae bacterium]